jgi:hypothetical protein
MVNRKTKAIIGSILTIITISLLIIPLQGNFSTQKSTKEAFAQVTDNTNTPNEISSEDIIQEANNIPSRYVKPPPLLGIDISQHPPSNLDFMYDFNITQGETIAVKITLKSLSNQTEFTIPLSLSVWAFGNQNLPNRIEIPLSPFSNVPALNQEYKQDPTKLFEANFNVNPAVLTPKESKTIDLTITALESTEPGVYTIDLQTGNTEQTRVDGIVFRLNVLQT